MEHTDRHCHQNIYYYLSLEMYHFSLLKKVFPLRKIKLLNCMNNNVYIIQIYMLLHWHFVYWKVIQSFYLFWNIQLKWGRKQTKSRLILFNYIFQFRILDSEVCCILLWICMCFFHYFVVRNHWDSYILCEYRKVFIYLFHFFRPEVCYCSIQPNWMNEVFKHFLPHNNHIFINWLIWKCYLHLQWVYGSYSLYIAILYVPVEMQI